jgi:DNA recombination protein RmuC
MNSMLLSVAIILVAVIVWLAAQISQSQKKSSTLESQLTELRRDLLSIAQTQSQSAGQIQSIGQSVSQRLESVTKALQDGVTSSAQIATQGQTAIAAELKNTREQILQLQEQIGAVHEQSRGLSLATQSIESILGGSKSRGNLGEVTLQRLLEDSLPQSQFSLQYRFSTGEAADAVIFLRDKKLMAIDSKFPLEAFRRIESDGDEARRAFAAAVKGHADSIAKKYIVPNEGTLDVALMFVPSETVYCEMLNTLDAKGQAIDAYCRDKKIITVSPNTLYANLCVIAMGMRGMQIEENARRILASLDGMKKQMETFADVFERLGNHLKNAQQSYAEANKRFEKAQDTLGGMLGQAPVQATLPLPDPK